MAQVIQASELTLSQVEAQFNLQPVLEDPTFFHECTDDLPELSEFEMHVLDRVKREFLYLKKYTTIEDLVKLVVLSPLLSLARFYVDHQLPILEKRLNIALKDRGIKVWRQINILALQQHFWVTVIEAKSAKFSLKEATAQTLFYMMLNPNNSKGEQPTFGLVTDGYHFLFIKLLRTEPPQYAFSPEFSLFKSDNELYSVLRVLKFLAKFNPTEERRGDGETGR